MSEKQDSHCEVCEGFFYGEYSWYRVATIWAKFYKHDTMVRATGCSIVVVCTIRVRAAAVRFRPARPEGGLEGCNCLHSMRNRMRSMSEQFAAKTASRIFLLQITKRAIVQWQYVPMGWVWRRFDSAWPDFCSVCNRCMKNTDIYQTIARTLGAMTGWILVPAILGGTLGTWLDGRYGTAPWLFLLILGLSFIISIVGVARIALSEFRRIDEMKKENSDDTV
jgi:hypothetical protein